MKMDSRIRRQVLDYGPVVLFGIAYFTKGMFTAIAVLMVATLIALAITYYFDRKLHPAPLFTSAVILIFGGMALYLKSAAFFKMKVTFVNALFGIILLGGLAFNRILIKSVFSYASEHPAFELDDQGWRKLTIRLGVFFLALAVLNEIVWRNFSDTVWVYAKIGMIVLTPLFAIAQLALILMKHQVHHETGGASAQE
jgi:intracellular septation protein